MRPGVESRLVTSLQNPVVKFVRSLELRKARRESGLFAAEGLKVIATARDLGWQPVTLLFHGADERTPFFRGVLEWARGTGADCLETSADILGKLSTRDNPQNAIAVFRQRWMEEGELGARAPGLWIALEQIRDPGNLGTIVRTADAAGAAGILLVGDCCDPYSREAVRASMGSIFNVRLARLGLEDFVARLPAWAAPGNGEIVGTHLSATEDYRRDYAADTLLVMGSEGPGLSEDIAGACTRLVRIPMTGSADSLNLSVATALMLFEIRRRSLLG